MRQEEERPTRMSSLLYFSNTLLCPDHNLRRRPNNSDQHWPKINLDQFPPHKKVPDFETRMCFKKNFPVSLRLKLGSKLHRRRRLIQRTFAISPWVRILGPHTFVCKEFTIELAHREVVISSVFIFHRHISSMCVHRRH